jgi:hypothetical protein
MVHDTALADLDCGKLRQGDRGEKRRADVRPARLRPLYVPRDMRALALAIMMATGNVSVFTERAPDDIEGCAWFYRSGPWLGLPYRRCLIGPPPDLAFAPLPAWRSSLR